MTIRFKKKVRKMRGGMTYGYGAKKKHRGKGSHGGKGYGGSTKHNRSYIYTKEPDHFGYKGFHSLRKKSRAINVGQLEKISKEGNEINLTDMGYDKLLSAGTVKKPFTVKVKKFTEAAKEKIEMAGGKIISDAL